MTDQTCQTESAVASSTEKLKKEFEKWVELAVTQGERALDKMGVLNPKAIWAPAVDVVETAESVEVFVNLPGINPADVTVTLAGNMLTVNGPAIVESRHAEDIVHVCERKTGSFSRAIPMPVAVEPEQVTAESKLGVLHVTLAKSEQVKQHHIPINQPEDTVHEGM